MKLFIYSQNIDYKRVTILHDLTNCSVSVERKKMKMQKYLYGLSTYPRKRMINWSLFIVRLTCQAPQMSNAMWSGPNDRHFVDYIFKYIILKDDTYIINQILLNAGSTGSLLAKLMSPIMYIQISKPLMIHYHSPTGKYSNDILLTRDASSDETPSFLNLDCPNPHLIYHMAINY